MSIARQDGARWALTFVQVHLLCELLRVPGVGSPSLLPSLPWPLPLSCSPPSSPLQRAGDETIGRAMGGDLFVLWLVIRSSPLAGHLFALPLMEHLSHTHTPQWS